MQQMILDSRLDSDTYPVGQLGLCHVRLMDDARFPWIILVPGRAGLTELTDLTQAEQTQLMQEICSISQVLTAIFKPDKLNVAALGNEVSQLHIHCIARFLSDQSWPNPVWGTGVRQPYPSHMAGSLIDRIAKELVPYGLLMDEQI